MSALQRDDQSPPTRVAEHHNHVFDIAAHELRTPITALKGHIQLLQRRLRKQPDRESDLAELRKMMYQVERLNHHIDIFLGLTHLTEDRFEIFPTAFDLTADTQRLVEMLNAGASEHAIELDADASIVGEWDRRRMNETLMALLANALKFSPHGDIIVRLRRHHDSVRVEVHDRGPGVPHDERYRIFEPYTTGSNAENAGAGLGLYIASEAVKRHDGRIGVRSRPGGGSIFWFEVPLKTPSTHEP